MKHPRVLEIMKRAVLAAQAPDVALLEGEGTVPVTSYTSAERFALEREKLFREMPLPIAHVGELSRESNVLVREVAGVSLLLTRGEDGAVRAFRGDIDGAGGLDAMSERAMRDIATLSYVLFPSTTLIMHPDWTSLVVVEPLAADRFSWSHTQLIAEEHAPRTDEARAHFDRSFDLIEGNVFQKEDLLMCAEMQAGIATGANTELTFGQLESPAVWLHASIAGVLQETRSNVTSTKA